MSTLKITSASESTLGADIAHLGATALRIADERNALLMVLRAMINAVDQHGVRSEEYDAARFSALDLLTRFK